MENILPGILKAKSKAPDFTLKNKDGEDIKLSKYNGKWVVLYFYPKDNTKGCTQQAIDFTELMPEFNKADAVILGVSPDSEKSHAKFIDKHNLKIELLSDSEHKILKKYGVWQLKKMAGREYMGVVRTTYLINPKGVIENVWEKVRVKNHVENVKETLCSLL